MTRRALVTLLVVATASVILPARSDPAECHGPPSTPPLAFSAPRYIDTARAGGEPVSVVAQDGAIIVSAHAGTTHLYKDPAAAPGASDFAVGYTNQTLNWRSSDGGDTWRYIGTAGAPAGAHSPTSTGFSDPDLTMDEEGTIYNVEIDLANVSVFSSLDDGQSFPIANAISASGDRPWVTAQQAGEVFLSVNAFISNMLFRSTDGGVTWGLQNDDLEGNGKLWNDPLNPEHGLIAPADDGFRLSNDDGKTWTEYDGAHLGPRTAFFDAIAVDRAGNVYAASAGGYRGPHDGIADGEVWINVYDRALERWGTPVQIPTPPGDALWPWLDAGDDGRVALVWYQNLDGRPDEFYIYAAYSRDARGRLLHCGHGETRLEPATFRVANASGRPVHVGKVCLQGTTCNLERNQQNADRRLGDFFTVNHTLDGTIFIVSGDTMLRSAVDGPKPVANPIFIEQSGGAALLETEIPARATRCLTPLPDITPEPVCHPWG